MHVTVQLIFSTVPILSCYYSVRFDWILHLFHMARATTALNGSTEFFRLFLNIHVTSRYGSTEFFHLMHTAHATVHHGLTKYCHLLHMAYATVPHGSTAFITCYARPVVPFRIVRLNFSPVTYCPRYCSARFDWIRHVLHTAHATAQGGSVEFFICYMRPMLPLRVVQLKFFHLLHAAHGTAHGGSVECLHLLHMAYATAQGGSVEFFHLFLITTSRNSSVELFLRNQTTSRNDSSEFLTCS